MKWIDVHTHLNALEITAEEALQRAQAVDVHRLITIGTSIKDLPVVVDLTEKLAPYVYCTLGVHPSDAETYDQVTEDFILGNLSNKKVAALGEMGLDYYYDNADREVQRKVFTRQLEMAVEHDLPVEIHTRDAEEDTLNILKSFGGKVKGILHCFTGTHDMAHEAIKLGLNISISGIVTFKNANDLRETVKSLPKDRIHVETDAPYLAPVPQRGKKNEPSFVVHTGHFVADLINETPEKLAEITCNNALKMFPKIQWEN